MSIVNTSPYLELANFKISIKLLIMKVKHFLKILKHSGFGLLGTILTLSALSYVTFEMTTRMSKTSLTTKSNKEIVYSSKAVSKGILSYTLYAIKERWCLDVNWGKDSACSTTNSMKEAVSNPLNLERLLWSDSTVNDIKERYFGKYGFYPPVSPKNTSITNVIDLNKLDLLGVDHPLNLIVDANVKKCIDTVTITIEKQNPDVMKPEGDEVYLKIEIVGKASIIKILSACAKAERSFKLQTLVVYYPRTLNQFSLIKVSDLDVTSLGSTKGKGISFNGPVYVQGDLILPNANQNVIFRERVKIGEGIMKKGSTPFSTSTFGGANDLYVNQLPTVGGFFGGIGLESERDGGLSNLFNVGYKYPKNTNMSECTHRQKLKNEMQLTKDSRLFIKGSLNNYVIGLSLENEFRKYKGNGDQLDPVLGLSRFEIYETHSVVDQTNNSYSQNQFVTSYPSHTNPLLPDAMESPILETHFNLLDRTPDLKFNNNNNNNNIYATGVTINSKILMGQNSVYEVKFADEAFYNKQYNYILTHQLTKYWNVSGDKNSEDKTSFFKALGPDSASTDFIKAYNDLSLICNNSNYKSVVSQLASPSMCAQVMATLPLKYITPKMQLLIDNQAAAQAVVVTAQKAVDNSKALLDIANANLIAATNKLNLDNSILNNANTINSNAIASAQAAAKAVATGSLANQNSLLAAQTAADLAVLAAAQAVKDAQIAKDLSIAASLKAKSLATGATSQAAADAAVLATTNAVLAASNALNNAINNNNNAITAAQVAATAVAAGSQADQQSLLAASTAADLAVLNAAKAVTDAQTAKDLSAAASLIAKNDAIGASAQTAADAAALVDVNAALAASDANLNAQIRNDALALIAATIKTNAQTAANAALVANAVIAANTSAASIAKSVVDASMIAVTQATTAQINAQNNYVLANQNLTPNQTLLDAANQALLKEKNTDSGILNTILDAYTIYVKERTILLTALLELTTAPPSFTMKTTSLLSNQEGWNFTFNNKNKLNNIFLSEMNIINLRTNAYDFAIDGSNPQDLPWGSRNKKDTMQPGPNAPGPKQFDDRYSNIIYFKINRNLVNNSVTIDTMTNDGQLLDNKIMSSPNKSTPWAILKNDNIANDNSEPPGNYLNKVTQINYPLSTLSTPFPALTLAEAKNLDDTCGNPGATEAPNWDISFTDTTQFSWLYNLTASGVSVQNASKVTPAAEYIFNKRDCNPSQGLPTRSVVIDCYIGSDVDFVFGFFVCENLHITPRTKALDIVGTFIVKNFIIDPSATVAGINFYSIWQKEATDLLEKYKILTKPSTNGPCRFVKTAAWNPMLTEETTTDLFNCSPAKYLYQGANNFNWTTVDPELGIASTAATQSVTQSKIVNRYRRFNYNFIWEKEDY